ncbi:MAG: deoxyguanosinetriphosphate triphosphohydrolase [Bacillota bacterium]|nr:deoxyguanosinetriphosphate triphosphohydrolase [Bacillota bacterium]
MTIREYNEKFEYEVLAEYAQKSADSVRSVAISPCDLRTEFQRDTSRIIHSKAFRRLKHKTQVFLSPEGDHYRTRLTHTLEVSQIARTIARALRLNEDLVEAVALGHDLGHTPFGHCGERVLNEVHAGGFRHNEQSKRVVEYLERHGEARGLNLTAQTVDGILCHSGGKWPSTHEGAIVRYSDKIAYIHHDIDDSIRAGILQEEDIPPEIRRISGNTNKERLDFFIHDLVQNYLENPKRGFSEDGSFAFQQITKYMFEHVYLNKVAKVEEERAAHVVEYLYQHFSKHPNQMPESWYYDYKNSDGIEAVKDFIASMSDRYAVSIYKSLFIPSFWY